MKVHKQVIAGVSPGFEQQAFDAWKTEGLIPGIQKLCTGLMVKHMDSITSSDSHVTCNHCLRKLNHQPPLDR